MSLTVRQLRYAVAAARNGNLTVAAKALHVSEPSVSMAITQIEEHFGRQVFVRQRGVGVSLTPFGQNVMERTKEVLSKIDALESLSDDASAIGGEFVLGCFEDLAPYCVASILARIAVKYPAISVIVREEGFDTIGRRLEDGSVDLAITYDLGLPASVDCTVLCELAPQALLAADHRLSAQTEVTLAELADETLVLTDQSQSWQHVLELFHLCDLRPARAIRTGSFELQRSMVANHLGVAIAYSRPYSDFSYDGRPLVRKPIADALPLQRILLAHNHNKLLSAASLAFMEEAKTWFGEMWTVPNAPV
jgi:DNA-binding transcriptional LysR family regulator